MENFALGIDLGTTYSCIAAWVDGEVKIIPNDHGDRTTPSYVAFTDTVRLIGNSAMYQSGRNPSNTVFGVKRLIGKHFDDPNIQSAMKSWPFQVLKGDSGKPKVQVEYRRRKNLFSPEEVSSMILYELKETAEKHLGRKLKDAVITVPAHFNDCQRQATKNAGIIAGLNVIRIINEPTAAALAYGLDKNLRGRKNVLIFDLGGGTFDVSILEICEGSVFEVKATMGDPHLGGNDFNGRIVEYLHSEFRQKTDSNLLTNPRAMHRLKSAAEQAKRTLSSSKEAYIELDELSEGHDLCMKITRDKLEELCLDLFLSTLWYVHNALEEANLEREEINDIVLIGGSTRIPMIQNLLRDFFHGKSLNFHLNPEEAVAYGAVVQAAIIHGHAKMNNFVLIDVTPLSVGIETAGGIMTRVIGRNTRIPTRQIQAITTEENNQTGVTIKIFEGERILAKDNNLLGEFDLTGIPPAPRGVPKIDVTFEIDENGILAVYAKDILTEHIKQLTVKNPTGRLSSLEIQNMMKSAEKFRADDDRERKKIAIRNRLERHAFGMKEAIIGFGDGFKDSQKQKIILNCEEVVEWLERNREAKIEELIEKEEIFLNYSDPILASLSDSAKIQ